MWAAPLLMAANCSPNGGDARPSALYPQQKGVPSRRSAHVWSPLLLLMAVNHSPAGGDAWPCTLYPQQKGVPSRRSAHVWMPPLLSVVCCSGARKPGGGAGYGVAVGVGVKVGVGVGGTHAVQRPQPSDARNPASVGRMETDAGAAVVSEKATSSPASSRRLRRAHSHWPETLAAS